MDSATAGGHSAPVYPFEASLDLEEAARFLHIHPVTLKNKARLGEIPGAKPGKRWVFLRIDLVRYVRSQYSTRALQGDSQENLECHSTSVKTRQIGGSTSVSKDVSEYRKALGLPTK